MNTKELIEAISLEIRQEGLSEFAIIVSDDKKCYVKGPIRPTALETALVMMGRRSPELRKAINRARTRLYKQLKKGGEA